MTWRLLLICLTGLMGTSGCVPEAEQPTRTSKIPQPTAQTEPAAQSQPAANGSAPLPSPVAPSFPAKALKPDDWFDGGDGKSRPLPFAFSDGSSTGNYTILEVMGGGASLLDYNRDGLLDIYVSGGGKLSPPPAHATGQPGALFQNRGDGQFVDVTRAAGLDDAGLYTHGAAVGDYNRDGYPDLFVAGYLGCRLYSNQRDGTFHDETAKSQLNCPHWNMTGCWADIDKDGWLDLYVVTYAKFQLDPPRVCINERKLRDVCLPTDFEGEADMLWRNRGDGTFEDVSHRAGVDMPGRGLGIVAADLDEDGWVDFYVANDVEENVLLYGGPDLAFSSEAIQAGAAYSPSGEREGSMGVDLGDYNGDGRPDIFYTNFATQDCSLLEMVAARGFASATTNTGLSGATSSWVGFGTAFADFDSDGWQDLFVINGNVQYDRPGSHYYQPAKLFRNLAGQRFVDVSLRGGPYFQVPHAGRGGAVGDLNNDGAPDLVIVHQQERVAVLLNRHPPKHWIGLRLQGETSNPDAIGARVVHHFAGRELTRWVRGGGSYLSSNDLRIVMPVDGDQPVSVTVRWPGGTTAVFANLSPDKYHDLVEGRDSAK